jgi:cysteine synthase A
VIEDRARPSDRQWLAEAVRRIEADADRSADTHLLAVPLSPAISAAGIDLYLKDESSHPTGSLKHRLARSLVLYGLVNGWIHEDTTLVEASSGSTAVSEAHFARLLGLPFVAVLPSSTSAEKVQLIEFAGGTCQLVDDPTTLDDEAVRVAKETGGHYLDQFRFAERATDWRGNNNIAESVFDQLRSERHPVPAWVVVGAGTGGTSATFGRYVRYKRLATQVCVVDPEGSAFYQGWVDQDPTVTAGGSRIEGIGRPRVEESFVPGVVDRMLRVPDCGSIAAARWLRRTTGWSAGGSTGTNLIGALHLVAELRDRGEQGSVVTLLCDRGDRYAATYFDDGWVAAQGLDLSDWDSWLAERT